MKRKILSLITIFSFSINPFLKKNALANIDKDSGYILSQISNFSVIFLFSMSKIKNIEISNVKVKNAVNLILSSLITIAGSMSLTHSLKDNENIAVHMATINSVNILCSFLIESYIKYEWLETKKIFGVIFICCGLRLLN